MNQSVSGINLTLEEQVGVLFSLAIASFLILVVCAISCWTAEGIRCNFICCIFCRVCYKRYNEWNEQLEESLLSESPNRNVPTYDVIVPEQHKMCIHKDGSHTHARVHPDLLGLNL